jgi:hypothetical protein
MAKKGLTDKQIQQDKTDKIMNIIAERTGYYRSNPQRWVEDFIPDLHLKLFQKILLWAMNHYDNFYFVASRGMSKTYLVALFALFRCICYPGTKCVCASYTFKQGKEIVLKITDDFMLKSALIRNEISKVSVGQNDCAIYFKNGSWMRVVVAAESSRGARSNVLLIDESRMVNQKIVDTVLKPMNSSPRQPGYLSKPEYAHLQEMNKEMYMSSAWYCASEMFEKVKAYTANMLNPDLNYFICDLPYTLSIKEGLLMRQQIENEMSEATFSDISFMMEREGLFYGSAEDALFDFKTLNDRRILEESLHHLDYYRDNNLKIPEKQKGELRILSVDIALLASKRHDNDASALMIHSAIPTSSHNYIDNIVFVDTQEGLVTEELGLLVMRYFYQYDCDYIAIDANGVGQSILDYLMADRFDPVYGQAYSALDCINMPELSERCKVKGAPKVIYAIKATAKSNNDMCIALRAGFQNGYINLLASDNNIEEKLSKIRGYSKLSDVQKAKLKLPYIQTSFLIDELINLSHDTSNGMIKVKERAGMRKDRYSSALYGWYVVQELSKKLKPKKQQSTNLVSQLTIRPARRLSSFE